MTAAARVDAQHSSEGERREPPNGSFDGAQNVQLCVNVDEFVSILCYLWLEILDDGPNFFKCKKHFMAACMQTPTAWQVVYWSPMWTPWSR